MLPCEPKALQALSLVERTALRRDGSVSTDGQLLVSFKKKEGGVGLEDLKSYLNVKPICVDTHLTDELGCWILFATKAVLDHALRGEEF